MVFDIRNIQTSFDNMPPLRIVYQDKWHKNSNYYFFYRKLQCRFENQYKVSDPWITLILKASSLTFFILIQYYHFFPFYKSAIYYDVPNDKHVPGFPTFNVFLL